jgi:putative SOS response-associated peptidase YedK
MCNRYETVSKYGIRTRYQVEPDPAPVLPSIGPLGQGDFITAAGAKVGQWGLIPPTSPTRRPATPDGRPLSTNNARRERMASAPTFRKAWQAGQRCLIPARSFDEPYWGTGKNIWWRFRQTDGQPWALAGLWSEWLDPASGELVPSYTMITQNCDGHQLLALMHKPERDPKTKELLAEQDKRTVVPLQPADWDAWLNGSVDQAEALIRVPQLELFDHGPADPAVQFRLPNIQ